MIGTVDALNSMICGARVPGGRLRRMNCDAELTCALAVSRPRALLQVNLDDDLSGHGDGLGVLDVIDEGGENLLVGSGQTTFKLLGIQPV